MEILMTDEQWKDIPNFEGLYQVSDLGRVKSLKRRVPHKTQGHLDVPERILRTRLLWGYPGVSLSKENRYSHRLVHRLVLEAFIGPCPKGMEACHGDDNKNNARLSNLRYGTRKENFHDRLLNGITRKLKLDQVQDIRERYARGDTSQQALGDEYGVSQVMISRIVLCKTWKL